MKYYDLDKTLAGDVLYLAIEGKGADQINQQSCDCNQLIIVMKDHILSLEHQKHGELGAIGIKKITSFSKDTYNLQVVAQSDKPFRFVKVLYHDDRTIDGIKYRYGDRYLFIFSSEYNLIITKSIMDLTEEDDTPIPESDPSVLFENTQNHVLD